MILNNSDITELCGHYYYLGEGYNIKRLSLASAKIGKVCQGYESTLDDLLRSKSLEFLDLSQNRINLTTVFRSPINHTNEAQLRLGGNNIKCSCSSLWMANWISSATTIYKKRLIEDPTAIKCTSGFWPGTPVYALKEYSSQLGCFPHELAREAIISLATIVVILVIVILLVIFGYKRRKEI